MAHILLTGATGFIGRSLLPRLVSGGHAVTCPVRDPSALAGTGAEAIGMDLSLGIDTRRLPGAADAVILLAQSLRYRDIPDGIGDMDAVNVASVANLLAWACGAGCEQVVLASSGNVYEPFADGMSEDAPLQPESYYASTKVAAESVLRGFRGAMRGCALRLFFPYGPGQAERVIPRLITTVRGGEPVTLAGEKDGIELTPTFVDDVAGVFTAALDQGWEGAVNVASPEVVSMRRLATEIGVLVGRQPVFETLGGAEPTPLVPDLDRLAGRYDLSGFVALPEGLKRTVAAAR